MLLAGLVASVLVLAVPGYANASSAPVAHDRSEVRDTWMIDCGFPVRVDLFRETMLLVREVRDSDGQAFLAQETVFSRTVYTNTLTGESMIVWLRATFKEMKAVHIEGTIWEVNVNVAGQRFVIEDADGKVITRSAGLVTHRLRFDTLGDGEPGGERISDVVIAVRGRDPLHLPECEYARELIG
jgi:hypothetical protein